LPGILPPLLHRSIGLIQNVSYLKIGEQRIHCDCGCGSCGTIRQVLIEPVHRPSGEGWPVSICCRGQPERHDLNGRYTSNRDRWKPESAARRQVRCR
jgi:hypothetical protein